MAQAGEDATLQGPGADGAWVETPDLADDVDRLSPAVGEAFEQTGDVTLGTFGGAARRLCGFRDLVGFATGCIDAADEQSGDRSQPSQAARWRLRPAYRPFVRRLRSS